MASFLRSSAAWLSSFSRMSRWSSSITSQSKHLYNFAQPARAASSSVPGHRYGGKVTIVTGGSKGIGEGIVRVFAEEGSNVVFCARGVDVGKKLETELNDKWPGRTMFVTCDMTKESDIESMVQTTVNKFGRLDCLVNNAGWHPPVTAVDDMSVDDFRYLLNFNLVSYFIASKAALPHLRKTQGNIINLSSLVGIIGQGGSASYVATKGGITSMSKGMAIDEAKHNVRVNVVSPGNVWTPLWNEFAQSAPDPQAFIKGGEDAQLLGRMGTIEESGKLCLFIAAEATFMTGIDFVLSGGAELNYGRKTQMD